MKLLDLYSSIIRDYRCPYCNRLLFKGKIRGDFFIQTKCPRNTCGKIVEITRNGITCREDNRNLQKK